MQNVYSLKCQSDQQRLEVLVYLSLDSFLLIFIYLNVHTFGAKHCCSIFLLKSLGTYNRSKLRRCNNYLDKRA